MLPDDQYDVPVAYNIVFRDGVGMNTKWEIPDWVYTQVLQYSIEEVKSRNILLQKRGKHVNPMQHHQIYVATFANVLLQGLWSGIPSPVYFSGM